MKPRSGSIILHVSDPITEKQDHILWSITLSSYIILQPAESRAQANFHVTLVLSVVFYYIYVWHIFAPHYVQLFLDSQNTYCWLGRCIWSERSHDLSKATKPDWGLSIFKCYSHFSDYFGLIFNSSWVSGGTGIRNANSPEILARNPLV